MADAKASAQPDQDQSMEEILQSIRRIIAEESDEPKADGEAMNGARGSDVLELTEIVGGDAPAKPSTLAGDVLSQIDHVLAPAEKPSFSQTLAAVEADAEPQPVSEVEAMPMPTTEIPAVSIPVPEMHSDALISEKTAALSSAAMKSVTESIVREVGRAPDSGASFRSGQTVEDLVQEALRPMLKSWLDANLPSLVERIVEKEVRRLSSSV